MLPSFRNQSIGLLCKSIDWFLYGGNTSTLNINSIRYKSDNLKTIINENLDILCISESKVDKCFTTAQFMLPGYHTPYCPDISDRKRGLLVYIKSRLPSRLLKTLIYQVVFKLSLLR